MAIRIALSMIRNRIAASVVIGCIACYQAQAADPPPGPPDAKRHATLESLWNDLASADETLAAKAVLALSAAPKDTVPFLQGKLKPVRVDPAKVKQWLSDLASDNPKLQAAAAAELEYLAPLINVDLSRAMERTANEHVRNRIEKIMKFVWADAVPVVTPTPIPPAASGPAAVPPAIVSDAAQPNNQLPPPKGFAYGRSGRAVYPAMFGVSCPSWKRAMRAAAILEHIGGPDAVTILKNMADGEIEAAPSQAAEDALIRLGESAASAEVPKIQALFNKYREANAKQDTRTALTCVTPEVKEELVFESYFGCYMQSQKPKPAAVLKKYGLDDEVALQAELVKRYQAKHGVDIRKRHQEYEEKMAKAIAEIRKKTGADEEKAQQLAYEQIGPPEDVDDHPFRCKVLAEIVRDPAAFIVAAEESLRRPGDTPSSFGELRNIRVRGDKAIGQAVRTVYIEHMSGDGPLQKTRSDSDEIVRFRKTKDGWLLETP